MLRTLRTGLLVAFVSVLALVPVLAHAGPAQPAAVAGTAAAPPARAYFDGFADQSRKREAVRFYTDSRGRRFAGRTFLPYPHGLRCGKPGHAKWKAAPGTEMYPEKARIATNGTFAWHYFFRHPQVRTTTVKQDIKGRFTGDRVTATYRLITHTKAESCDSGTVHMQASIPRYEGQNTQGYPVRFRIAKVYTPSVGDETDGVTEINYSMQVGPWESGLCADGQVPPRMFTVTNATAQLDSGGEIIGDSGLISGGFPAIKGGGLQNRSSPAKVTGTVSGGFEVVPGISCTAETAFTAQRTHPGDAFVGKGYVYPPHRSR